MNLLNAGATEWNPSSESETPLASEESEKGPCNQYGLKLGQAWEPATMSYEQQQPFSLEPVYPLPIMCTDPRAVFDIQYKYVELLNNFRKLQRENEILSENRDELCININSYKYKIQKLQGEKREKQNLLVEEFKKLEDLNHQLVQQNRTLVRENQNLKYEKVNIREAKRVLREERSYNTILESEIDKKNTQLKNMNCEIENLQTKQKTLKRSYEDSQRNNAELRSKLTTMPSQFTCPITFEVMNNPVITADGHSYEKEAIEDWLSNHKTSPNTNETLDHIWLIPNHALRSLIASYNERLNCPVKEQLNFDSK